MANRAPPVRSQARNVAWLTTLSISLVALLVLSACSSTPTRLTGESPQTRSAIAAHKACAARNLDALIAEKAPGSIGDRAVAAEKPCVLEREALRNAVEVENRAMAESGTYEKLKVAGFADASTRFMQQRLLRELEFAQTQVRGPVEVSVSGNHCVVTHPIFPASISRDRSFPGASVTAQFDILPGGSVNSVVVIRSSGYRDLDAAVFTSLIGMTCDARPDASEKVLGTQTFDFRFE